MNVQKADIGTMASTSSASVAARQPCPDDIVNLWACNQGNGNEYLMKSGPRREMDAEAALRNEQGRDYFVREVGATTAGVESAGEGLQAVISDLQSQADLIQSCFFFDLEKGVSQFRQQDDPITLRNRVDRAVAYGQYKTMLDVIERLTKLQVPSSHGKVAATTASWRDETPVLKPFRARP